MWRGARINSPWTFAGAAKIAHPVPLEQIVEVARAMFGKQGMSIEVDGQNLSFRDESWPFGGGNRWSALAIFEAGQLQVSQRGADTVLNYEVRSRFAFWFICFFASIVFVATGLSGGVADGFGYFFGTIGFLYGSNLLLGAFRVPHFFNLMLRRAAAQMAES